MKNREAILQDMAQLYQRLDETIRANVDPLNDCFACGACCDFENYGHRLFVTPPEMLYFSERQGGKPLRKMTIGVCPYREAGKCTAHGSRFAGCRIFGCRRDTQQQQQWSEDTLRELKAICAKHGMDYRYADLATALSQWEAEQAAPDEASPEAPATPDD